MNLSAAKVLVTGGSSGIGLEAARLLRSAGAQVAIAARDESRLLEAAKSADVFAIQADVSQESSVKQMVARVIGEFGNYNVLINNAGYGYITPLLDIDLDKFQQQIATNLTGAMLVARESAKHFVKQNYGNILNIGSTSSLRGVPRTTTYAASKFALRGMTEVWRGELRQHNIRVMQINPSEVLTNFATVTGREQAWSNKKLQAEDIAHAIKSALEMDDRGFITELTVWATNPD